MNFLKKHWKWILLAVIVIIVVSIYMKRRKNESGFDDAPCKDCGPGGMFGPGWTMGKFQASLRENNGSVPIGSEAYKRGRQIAINRMEKATEDLRDVMNTPGVYGIGTIRDIDVINKKDSEYIEIAVKDEVTRKKVIDWVNAKNKALNLVGNQEGLSYNGYPVNVIIRDQTKAQRPNNDRGYIIGSIAEKEILSNQDTARTFDIFKALFTNGPICNIGVLKSKGIEKGLTILESNETHAMQFDPRRVIVSVAHTKCVGDKCPTRYGVISIG